MRSPGNKVNVTKSRLSTERSGLFLWFQPVCRPITAKVNGEFASTSCCRL